MVGPASETIHGTCVAWQGRAALLLGRSGSGKSAVALQMMGMGAELVADDQVRISAEPDGLWASAPPRLAGLIEARGIGLLQVAHTASARIVLAVDMEMNETTRLPQLRTRRITSGCVPLIAGAERPYLSQEVLACLRYGREPLLLDPDDFQDTEDKSHADRN